MSVGLYSHTTRAIGTVLTAAIYNSDHTNHITNQNPVMTGAYADSVGQYQTNTDPGGVGSESLPANLAGEFERLRFAIKRITGKAQWYVAPAANLDQTLNAVNAGEIAVAGSIPLTLRRTENDTTARIIQRYSLGSGAGDDLDIQVKGTGANNVTEASLLIGAQEILRVYKESTIKWDAQGYLTPTQNVPIIVADAAAVTSVWYEPLRGNLVPFIISSTLVAMRAVTASLQLSLNNPNHAANTLYDVYIFDDSGTIRIVTSPAWSNSGAGTSARGTGAGTAELSRHALGLITNAVQQTVRNGASTFTMPALSGTYIGTILTAAVGTLTCHVSYGQNRLWGIWNFFNRRPVFLKAGDPTASWSYGTNTIRASNNDATNRVNVLCGLAEDNIKAKFQQKIQYNDGNPATVQMQVGIGLNSTTTFTGLRYDLKVTYNAGASSNHLATPQGNAEYMTAPLLGLNQFQSLERTVDAGSSNDYFGTESDMVLSAHWMA